SGVDHQSAAAVIYENRNQQVIAVPSLQLRTGKSLAGERASECSALLPLCAKWRDCCEQKYRDHFLHALVLEQGCRCVEPHSNVLHYTNRSTKANEAVETASVSQRLATPA